MTHFVNLIYHVIIVFFFFFPFRSYFLSERGGTISTTLWDLLLLRWGLARQKAQGEKAYHCPGVKIKSMFVGFIWSLKTLVIYLCRKVYKAVLYGRIESYGIVFTK